jgi:hypothetical protein
MVEPTASTETTATTPSESKFRKIDIPTLLSKSRKAQDIKIYVVPYFLKIYEELFAELDNIKKQKKTEKTIVIKKGPTSKELKQAKKDGLEAAFNSNYNTLVNNPPTNNTVDKFDDFLIWLNTLNSWKPTPPDPKFNA